MTSGRPPGNYLLVRCFQSGGGCKMPDRYVLIGGSVSKSPTPNMMNAAFGSIGLDATYEAIEVGADHLEASFGELSSSGVSGLNITIPHKTSIIRLLDSLEELPRSIGAVNTVK